VEEAEAAAKAAQVELDAAKAAAESHYRHNMREAVQRVTLFKDVSDINERLAAAGGSAEEVAYVRECRMRFALGRVPGVRRWRLGCWHYLACCWLPCRSSTEGRVRGWLGGVPGDPSSLWHHVIGHGSNAQ
jgi:hypothetical protein